MSGLGDIVDGISSLWDNNKNWLKPVISAGTSLLNTQNESSARNNYYDLMKSEIDRQYADRKAYNEQVSQYYKDQAAARSAASAARASGLRAQESSRLQALAKATKAQKKALKKSLALYQPYIDAGKTLLPQQTQTYSNALNLMNTLSGYLSSDKGMNILSGTTNWGTEVPLPDSLKNKKD